VLYRIIGRHDNVDAIYSEAQKTFKWDLSQVKAAVDPILKRHSTIKITETPKKLTRRKLK
jgi:hypothetical protein